MCIGETRPVDNLGGGSRQAGHAGAVLASYQASLKYASSECRRQPRLNFPALSCDLPKMTQEPQPKLYCCQDLKDWLIGQPVRAMKNSEQSAKLPIPIVYALAFEEDEEDTQANSIPSQQESPATNIASGALTSSITHFMSTSLTSAGVGLGARLGIFRHRRIVWSRANESGEGSGSKCLEIMTAANDRTAIRIYQPRAPTPRPNGLPSRNTAQPCLLIPVKISDLIDSRGGIPDPRVRGRGAYSVEGTVSYFQVLLLVDFSRQRQVYPGVWGANGQLLSKACQRWRPGHNQGVADGKHTA
ncbi:hypothetical protein CIB48_g2537 [Xylaria polymorpha]|nr:hypothetical protein CIB48_g2537 [Xylaria polymorpha]